MSIYMLRGESPGFPLILVTIVIRQLSPDSLPHFCVGGYPDTQSDIDSRLPPSASSPSPYTRKRGPKSVAYCLVIRAFETASTIDIS
ncbi:hypothetical protein M408DRAFT_331696 [Serendipita vermifera MAFF 305830]|uniref:Uncharacterized protein n=1 Tax=Serendipita vermifera MAFF 305830 TaxID=933852 RepID=A0A0C3AZQ9_SERVB|nr:hypothetical protein M408DRAFT_331696 [Serendipita vermifera MAFF 305830]